MRFEPREPAVTPAEEDPVVHKFLGTLPRPEPRRPLETAVLKRVWRPLPRTLRERWTGALTSWQAKMFLGLLAAGAFVWQAALVSLAVQFPNETRQVVTLVTSELAPLASDQIGRLLGLAGSSVLGWIASYGAWLAAFAIVTIISAIGLIRVLRAGRMTHVWQ